MVGRRVADAIAAGLDRVHLHFGELGQNIRHILELGPVELNVLPGREVPVAAIVAARNARQGAQLSRGEQPIRDGHPQHRGMALDVQAIAQAQMAKFVVAELTGQETPRLVAKLCDALVYQRFVDCVIPIHAPKIRPLPLKPPITGLHELMTGGPVQLASSSSRRGTCAHSQVQNRDLLDRGKFRLRAASWESV